MNEIFDPTNLVLAGIAAIILWRLWAVLGTRTGHERSPMDVPSPLKPIGSSRQSQSQPAAEPERGPIAEVKPIWTNIAAEGSPLALALEKIAAADASFDPKAFLSGARTAYEMVSEAFAAGNKAPFKNLLAPDVLEGFSKAIDARQASRQKLEYRFIGFEKAEIKDAELDGKRAILDVKFVPQIVSATYDAGGALLEGDPNAVRESTDIWSFERDVTQSNPNWRVIATQSVA